MCGALMVRGYQRATHPYNPANRVTHRATRCQGRVIRRDSRDKKGRPEGRPFFYPRLAQHGIMKRKKSEKKQFLDIPIFVVTNLQRRASPLL